MAMRVVDVPGGDARAEILAAIRRAPPCSPEDRALAQALLAEVQSDPKTWPTRSAAETMAWLEEHHPGTHEETGEDGDDE